MQQIAEITIPEYITKVRLSKKRNAKYYSIKNKKWKPRDLPITYQKRLKSGTYQIYKGYLVDKNKNKIIANPHSVGKAKYEKLSGNSFASGYGSPMIRAKLVREIKNFYRPFVREQLEPIPLERFPIWIDWYLYTTIPDRMFDLSNFWFYYKYFEDCLFETEDSKGRPIDPIIPDDNIRYITKPGTSPILCPVNDWKDRKFVFKIYSDERECLKEHDLWSK